MDAYLRRLFVRGSAQFGVLGFLGEEPCCFTLEDLPRETKIAGETCIGPGRYELTLRTFGRLYSIYRSRYPWNEPGMLWLQNVSNFKDVLIHCGNTDKDTAGCLLVGYRADVHRPSVSSSVDAYELVYKRLSAALLRGERCYIEVLTNGSLPT